MIVGNISELRRYESLNLRFGKAIDFLENSDLNIIECGRYDIAGDDVYATVVETELRDKASVRPEVHDKYIDIQMVISGVEQFGWAPRESLSGSGEFDRDNDIMFFDDMSMTYIELTAGQTVIFFPSDVHAPLVGSGRVRKVIVKVKI